MDKVEFLEILVEHHAALDLSEFIYNRIGNMEEQISAILTRKEREDLVNQTKEAKTPEDLQKIMEKSSSILEEKGKIEFLPDSTKAEILSVVYHEYRGNASLLCKQTGKILLPAEAPAKLENPFPTYQFRSFCIIKDGMDHALELPLYLSKELHSILSKTIDLGEWEKNKVFHFRLSDFENFQAAPISERSYFSMKHSYAKAKARKKVISAFLEKENPGVPSRLEEKFSYPNALFLKKIGILDSGAFSPAKSELPKEGGYTATEIYSLIRGLYEIPSYKKLEEKISKNKKKFGRGEEMMLQVREECLKKQEELSRTAFVEWLKEEKKDCERFMTSLGSSLAQIRIAWLNSQEWVNLHREKIERIYDLDGQTWECSLQAREASFSF